MEIAEGALVTRLTIIAITISLVGGGLTWLDARHASAGDVQELKISIDKDRLQRIEYKIEDIDRSARVFKRMPIEQQESPEMQSRALELRTQRDRYLRKREELLLEIGDK